ncbi:MAG: phospholipase D-like domain-containing anti-phage protein [Meiothermus sp.]|nr:phospholipase D-like domain-containing anti-phage protein [Meiothermus sp.]
MINRFSSRRQRIDRSFLASRLQGALTYDRIAGYFSSSLLEVVGEELDSIQGQIRVVCNSDLAPEDVQVAKAAVKRSWTASEPEKLLDSPGAFQARERFQRLYQMLSSGKLEVRVLPDEAFGLVHGKAGVITLADGNKLAFMGSANESKSAWKLNYELVWEDSSLEAVSWVQEEFDALWLSPYAIPLAEAVIQDVGRLAERKVIVLADWARSGEPPSDPAPAIVEAPVLRQEAGLWDHQKYFVKTVFDAHHGPIGKARFILADQVGLGKTLQLAMAAQLIALTGEKPILILAPKPLLPQWQDELMDKLGMPSAVWDGKNWIDENEIVYPARDSNDIKKCPRRVGLISTGLIKRKSDSVTRLLDIEYDCVILDEAHHARRRNLGPGKDEQKAEPNNLLAFIQQIAFQTRSLLLATATPVQLRPIEAWDLLEVLSRGDDSVLGSTLSRWRKPMDALEMVMSQPKAANKLEMWDWVRDPLPPKTEDPLFAQIRMRLGLEDDHLNVPGNRYGEVSMAQRQKLEWDFKEIMQHHNPFIRRIIRRTREYLENTLDPETSEPYLKKIDVVLWGEQNSDAVSLPSYLKEAYDLAEEFCRLLQQRLPSGGFLKTLLLRRIGSSVFAGMQTVQKMLSSWQTLPETVEDDEAEDDESISSSSMTLTKDERELLEKTLSALQSNRERDPKHAVVLHCLRDSRWLEKGCIVFSQYRDSVLSLAKFLSAEFPHELIGVYSGPDSSGLMLSGEWQPQERETLKQLVRQGKLRLLLGTDAASEGLNLQRLGRLINLDLPWNPTRLEQRKGRIQRIGQLNDSIEIYNLRYLGSVEDRVHQLLSTRLQSIHTLFGQIPDVLEDVWINVALGQQAQARQIIDALPEEHPFTIRYTDIEKIDWETCNRVLSSQEKLKALSVGWIGRSSMPLDYHPAT